MAEAKAARLLSVHAMHRNSAPGPDPDGFGPAFYCTVWASISLEIERLVTSFSSELIDLERINRAHIILLLKKPGATAVDAYRSISLQNLSVKLSPK